MSLRYTQLIVVTEAITKILGLRKKKSIKNSTKIPCSGCEAVFLIMKTFFTFVYVLLLR